MIRIGLIGAGFMGNTHSVAYSSLKADGAGLVAVADLEPDKAAKLASTWQAKVYPDGLTLIENADVDVIDICVPTPLHSPLAIQAMRRGRAVFIEKPVCRTEAQAVELLQVQQETGAAVAVGHCIRFWDEYRFLKDALDQGTYGRLIQAVFTRLSPRPVWAWRDWYSDAKQSGLAALDLHIHDTDFARWLLGEPDSVRSVVNPTDLSAEHIWSVFSYPETTLVLEGGWDYPGDFPFEMSYRARFEQATLVFSSRANPTLSVLRNDGGIEHPDIAPVEDAGDLGGNLSAIGGYRNELRYFLQCLNAGQKPKINSLTEAVASFRLVGRELTSALVEAPVDR